MSSEGANPRISRLLQAVTGFETPVLVGAGGGLLLQPTILGELWPWTLTPFNAAFLGAIYASAMLTTFLLVLIGRWSPARVAVPMILVFTVVVLAVSLIYLDRFRLGSPATWLWFVLYVGIPVNAGYHLWLYRGLAAAGTRQWGAIVTGLLHAEAAVFAFYGLTLLLWPERSSAFWPWPVDAFHARMYSVAFLTPAIGLWLIARVAAWAEVLALAVTLVAGGVLSIVALIATDMTVHRVDWTAPGTWLWICIFAVLALTGGGLLRSLRSIKRPAGAWNESALIVPLRETALVLGVAFTVAGIAGFLPAFTHAVPHEAPSLGVSAAYGYLLGLFPVNAVHSLFHLIVGIGGIAAWLNAPLRRPYVRGFAIALATLTVMGLLPGFDVTFGLAPLFGHDVWLHGVEAVAAGYIGFVMPDAAAESGFSDTARSPATSLPESAGRP
jgi:hypothetical protein